MATANESLQEEAALAAIALMVALRAYRRITRRELAQHDRGVLDVVRASTDRPSTPARLRSLLERVHRRINDGHDAFETRTKEAARERIGVARDREIGALEAVLLVPGAFGVAVPLVGQAARDLRETPTAGRTQAQWLSKLRADKHGAVEAAVRSAVDTPAIVPDVRTALNRASNSSTAIGATLVGAADAAARDAVWRANESFFADKIWISVLDSRTTREFCIPRNGKRYTILKSEPIGHRFPWRDGPGRIHPGCRSSSHVRVQRFQTLANVISGGLGSFLRRLRRRGMTDDQIAAVRSSLAGDIPSAFDLNEWLPRQSASLQNDVLGRTRARLLRSGSVSMDQFYNRQGRLRRLDELRLVVPEAFMRRRAA